MTFVPMTDAGLVLQAAVTKAASFNGAWLDLGEGYAPGGLGEPAAAVVAVTALDVANLDETYLFVLEQAAPDAAGLPDAATVGKTGAAVAVTAAGLAVVKGLITQRFIRLAVTVAGTTPSITYSALVGR